ncbi:tripeptidyl aminopeptidase [Fusarium tjaetaba]|uniref:Tripeptidyl aminopeptidase n=1 Tax=Fusarium tjaetaba TaxID=1567544 RepID=A0A8H5R8R4_9HYPO|nr:tripeptidyl aminopeptidase [Fusarium tjaetaba]KAF5628779.1 tripeptidyl aminopeptidase [Fusarium tjaetaba]
MKVISIIPIHLFLFLHCTHATFLPKDDAPDTPRDVHNISPNNSIRWTRCNLRLLNYKDVEYSDDVEDSKNLEDYGDLENNEAFECGNLTVPLDYTGKYSSNTTTLNLIKLKATEKSPKGSIILNFGGPGASGIDDLRAYTREDASRLVGGQYDLISFDPRGTGKTLVPPSGEGFPSQMLKELFYAFQNSSDFETGQSLRDAWDYVSTFTESFLAKDTDLRRFRGTAFVARDIAEIATALGEGNRINYWGMSYGTVLGQVLASMFPDRIERMLLEGNLLADDYVKNLGAHATQDAGKALYHFYDLCMAAPNNTCHSATKLPKNRDEFLKVLDRVFMVCTGVGGGLRRFKSLPLNAWFFLSLYGLQGYYMMDELIATALDGNRSNCPQVDLDPLAKSATPWNPQFELAHLSTWCSDTTFRPETVEELLKFPPLHEGDQALDNPFYLTALLPRLVCSQWIHAAEPINLTSLSRVETKNPILLINGKYDPITPLGHARKISARFPGSQLVVGGGVGHASSVSPYGCPRIGEIVRRYFTTGELPLPKTTCEPGLNAFEVIESMRGKGPEPTGKRKIPILL